MNASIHIDRKERILGGLWGALVGDALGVPVEFQTRQDVQSNPVTDMRGHGTHDQPRGTWSDDGALTLCTVDSLLHHEFDAEDLGKRFVGWYNDGLWTAHGNVFDVGVATSHALSRISQGMRAEVAGGDGQYSNGNGSLMRILPVGLRFSQSPLKTLLNRTHRASSVTHRHARSQMACGLYVLMLRALLSGAEKQEAFARALGEFRALYEPDPFWCAELYSFQLLLLATLPDVRNRK